LKYALNFNHDFKDLPLELKSDPSGRLWSLRLFLEARKNFDGGIYFDEKVA
jgi:hypothetical protein